MKILYPPALTKGDTIGVIAPAHPFPQKHNISYFQQYLQGKTELEKMGFKIEEAPNLKARQWWRAGTPKQRADDINTMFGNAEIKAIIAHDGGNDCISVLEYLDFSLIKNNPKPFIGFSNITNIHSALFAKIGLIGFHMGLISYELGKYWQIADQKLKEAGFDLFYSALTKKDSLKAIKPLTRWETWRSGKSTGRLFGGNLSMLDSLVGTPYFPKVADLKDSIFFWELDNTPSYRIERVLTHLKYIGLFEIIKGMIVGKLVDIKKSITTEDQVEPSYKDIILTVVKDYDFPVLGEVDFGHKMVQIPMLIGLKVNMDADLEKFEYLESGVV